MDRTWVDRAGHRAALEGANSGQRRTLAGPTLDSKATEHPRLPAGYVHSMGRGKMVEYR